MTVSTSTVESAFSGRLKVFFFHSFFTESRGFFEVDMGNYLMHKDFYIFRFY